MSEAVDRFLHLPEDEACERHADAANAEVLWRLAVVLGTISAGAALMFFALEKLPHMGLALGDVVLIAILYLKSSSTLVTRHFRALTITFLLVHLGLAVIPEWPSLAPPLRVGLALILFPVLVLFFRLRRSEILLLFVPMWGLGVWIWLTELTGLWEAPQKFGGLLWPTLTMAAFAAGASNLSFYRRRRFLAEWRRAASQKRERERMREEIEDARQIQLSMLPRTTPDLDGLDLSGASMPASEVGGDYYDYFPQEDGSLGLVVGDVAGHGLSSGLLLASVRGCLYLLRRDLGEPVAVLEKLDDMVRHTASRRMLVTLQCAYFDAESRRITLANAGHPPALLWRSTTRRVEELAVPALPLGTHLGGRFRALRVDLDPGDLLLFYTDGLIEMANVSGDAFGSENLTRILAEAATHGSARDVRNAVLAELANFKGDTRRADDVTLVVVRVR